MAKLRIAESDERGRPKKHKLPMEDIGVHVGGLLDSFQQELFDRAAARMRENTVTVDTWDEFQEVFAEGASKFVYAHWDGTSETELAIKEETKATIRSLPIEEDALEGTLSPGKCVKTGRPSARKVLFAKAY